MIGCTLKWSLLNFKQANSVLATKAVAALCGGSALLCTPESVCVCVRECVAAQSLVLLLVGPGLLRHRPGQVEKKLAWKCLCFRLLFEATCCRAAVCVNTSCLAV